MTQPNSLTGLNPRSLDYTATKRAFDEYAAAVGRLSYAWNTLHLHLGALFFAVVGARETGCAMAAWRSLENDHAQRRMLRAAVSEAKAERWKATPKAPDDLKWLLDRVDGLSDTRNNAIHALTVLDFGGDEPRVTASTDHQGRREKNLVGVDLISKFVECSVNVTMIEMFAQSATFALVNSDRSPLWPDRPKRVSFRARA
jgi:hypothetical protein